MTARVAAPAPLVLSGLAGGPAAGTPFCNIADLGEAGAMSRRFGEGATAVEIFVQIWRGQVVAYVNSCPHVGTPLDWQPDRFLDKTQDHLICATHGALFDVLSGHCLSGPCAGAHLQSVAIRIDGDTVRLL